MVDTCDWGKGALLAIAFYPLLLAQPSKSIGAVAIDAPPVVDGRLDESVWQHAALVTHMTQVEPTPGEPMSEPMEVRVVFDQKAIYLGMRCFDREPSGILARGRERDGSVLSGDHVSFFFDTFHDRRNGYAFAVSPDEGRWDALVSNNFNANTDWDGTWEARCKTNIRGWTAEIAIPFKTVAYDPKGEVWGFSFSRNIALKGESGRWNSPRPEGKVYSAGNAGTLIGLRGLPINPGIEVSPYFLARKQKGEDVSGGMPDSTSADG